MISKKRHPKPKSFAEALERIEKLSFIISNLEAQLALVDEALARRPALAGFTDRYSKICHMCTMAGNTDAALQSLLKCQEESEKLLLKLREAEERAAAKGYKP